MYRVLDRLRTVWAGVAGCAVVACAASCRTAAPTVPAPPVLPIPDAFAPAPPAPVPATVQRAQMAELVNPVFLREIMQHLYRWNLDERDFPPAGGGDPRDDYWVCVRHPRLDEGDRSAFGEIMIPAFGRRVLLKKADYTIEETGVLVTNNSFKITNVEREPMPGTTPPDFVRVTLPQKETRDLLFKTRAETVFPSRSVLEQIQLAVRREWLKEVQQQDRPMPQAEQAAYLAPISPVANEIWVYWESSQALLRFSSDSDLTDPGPWERGEVAVKKYMLGEKVVVSLEEVPGSNAFVTREQVSRILFHCMVQGKRLVVPPPDGNMAMP